MSLLVIYYCASSLAFNNYQKLRCAIHIICKIVIKYELLKTRKHLCFFLNMAILLDANLFTRHYNSKRVLFLYANSTMRIITITRLSANANGALHNSHAVTLSVRENIPDDLSGFSLSLTHGLIHRLISCNWFFPHFRTNVCSTNTRLSIFRINNLISHALRMVFIRIRNH